MFCHSGRCTSPIGCACTRLTNYFNISPNRGEDLGHNSCTVDLTQCHSSPEKDHLAHFAIHMYCKHIQNHGKLANDKPANEDSRRTTTDSLAKHSMGQHIEWVSDRFITVASDITVNMAADRFMNRALDKAVREIRRTHSNMVLHRRALINNHGDAHGIVLASIRIMALCMLPIINLSMFEAAEEPP